MEARNQPISFSAAPMMWRVILALYLVETAYVLLFVIYLVLRPPIDAVSLILALWVLQTVKFAVMTWLVANIVTAWAGHGAFVGGTTLTLHSGLVKAEDTVYELAQLRSVSLRQGWLGRRLNYGTIELKFGRLGSSLDVDLVDVHNPDRYMDMLAGCIGETPA